MYFTFLSLRAPPQHTHTQNCICHMMLVWQLAVMCRHLPDLLPPPTHAMVAGWDTAAAYTPKLEQQWRSLLFCVNLIWRRPLQFDPSVGENPEMLSLFSFSFPFFHESHLEWGAGINHFLSLGEVAPGYTSFLTPECSLTWAVWSLSWWGACPHHTTERRESSLEHLVEISFSLSLGVVVCALPYQLSFISCLPTNFRLGNKAHAELGVRT